MITFETPGPVAPAVSAGYGAAEQFSRTLPTIAGLYAQQAQLRQQQGLAQAQLIAGASAADADRQARTNEQAAALAGRDRESQGQLTERRAEYAASREASPRDEFLAQQAAGELRQKAELQAWLSRQEISQAEEVRYQRMRNAVDAVNDPANGLLPHERQADLLRLRTGIDTFDERRKFQQGEALKQHTQMEMDAAARQKTIETHNEEFEKQLKEKGEGVMRWADPNTGRIHLLMQNKRTGEWYNPVQSHGTGDATAGRDEGAARKEFQDAYTKAVTTVDRWVAATHKDKDGISQPAFPQYHGEGGDQNYRAAVNRETARHLGYTQAEIAGIDADNPPTAEGHLARRRPGVAGGQGGAPGGKAAERSAPPAEAVQRAVNIYRQSAEDFQGLLGLSTEEKTQGTVAARQAADLLEKSGGDLSKLSPEDLALYQRARDLQIGLAQANKDRLARRRGPAPVYAPQRAFPAGTGPTSKF